MLFYVAHNSPSHDHRAALAKSGLAASSKEIIALSSADFSDNGKAATPGDYPTRDLCFRDTLAMIVLVPPARDGPIASVSVGAQIGSYIEICRQKNAAVTRIYCLHHPDVVPAEVVAVISPDAVLVAATEANVAKMVGELFPEEARETVLEIIIWSLLASVDARVPTARYTTAPVMTLSVMDEEVKLLRTGKIPPDAVVGGEGWEEMFAQKKGQAGLTWADVRDDVANVDQWEPILAGELVYVLENYHQRDIVPVLLKESTQVPPAAVVVQKYETFARDIPSRQPSPMHRFSLVSFRMPMLFDPSDDRLESTAFHLAVVAQLFRFSILEDDLKALKKLQALVPYKGTLPEFAEDVDKAMRNLRRHFLLIDVECRRRSFTDRIVGFDSLVLNSHPGDAKEKVLPEQERLNSINQALWMPLRQSIDADVAGGAEKLKRVVDSLEALAKLNAEVLVVASGAYARLTRSNYGDPPL